MRNWGKEDKKITDMWDKIQYFDSQPIIWVCKNSLFSTLKFFEKCLKSVYLFAWGIEKQHQKVEKVWWKIEYFHSQPIIRYTHIKAFFQNLRNFELFFQVLPKICQNKPKPLFNPMILKFLRCKNIHSRAENVQNHVFRKNTWCRAETSKRRFF